MKRSIVFAAFLTVASGLIVWFTMAADGGDENHTTGISLRAIRIDAQLGLRLDRDLPDTLTEGESFDARVVNPAKLMVLGMREVRKGDRVILKILPDGHFQVVRQLGQPHVLQLNNHGRVVTPVPR